jgi:uncharacterized membrane-anchored protein
MSLISYEKTEENCRKYWLLSSFAVFVLFPTFGLLTLVVGISGKIPTYERYGLEGCIAVALFMCVCSIPVLLLYFFAYKKHGNKLLSYLAFLIPFKRLIIWMIALLSQNIWIIIAGVLDIAVTGVWCVLSFKMKKINKKIRSFKLSTKMGTG